MYIIIFPLQFAVGYQRLNGKRCLFPFAFHCTGMPIMVGYTARLAWCYGTAVFVAGQWLHDRSVAHRNHLSLKLNYLPKPIIYLPTQNTFSSLE